MKGTVRLSSESGVALIAALLVMLLLSTLMAGFTVAVMGDQQNRWVDRERTVAFYAGHAAVEQLTASLGDLFVTNYAPNAKQIAALTKTPPILKLPAAEGVTFVAADGSSGYTLLFKPDANGNPSSTSHIVSSGPFAGMTGLITTYTADVVARTSAGGEVHLRRPIQTVAVPIFQFGVFSETDLSFHPGPAFNFGGRVHSNANLYLAAGTSLTLTDKVTAVGEVIRTNMINGWPTSSGYTGPINIVTTPGSTRPLAMSEGSLVGTIGSALNDPTWTNVSMGPYNGNIRNGRTGARRLNLATATMGGQPLDLVRRPPSPTENVSNPGLFGQRYFSIASLRILLSDTPAAIQNLPTVTSSAPVSLETDWTKNPPAGYNGGGGVDPNHPPVALADNGGDYKSQKDTSLLGGYIKIEAQDPNGNWTDVTMAILNLGIAGANPATAGCGQPNPNAVIRIERLRDDPPAGNGNGTGNPKWDSNGNCGNGSTQPTDYWPNVLFDPREGLFRDAQPAGPPGNVPLGGVMHYIELDVTNLSRWLSGQNVMNTTGYVVYFSDRRTNHDASGNETAEYGFEDNVNPADPAGAANGTLDAGEDVNGNGVLDTYGETPTVPAGGTAPLDGNATPWTTVAPRVALANRSLFFRRALKLTNGSLGSIIAPGLTVVSENPVYIQGDYNAGAGLGFGDPHVATAVLADGVTLLSNNWNDLESINSPYTLSGRQAADTWYRVAVISGKTPAFPLPAWSNNPDNGSDGGVHNFVRYIENWSNGSTSHYRGSLASLYYSRQATGTFKCCSVVYTPPVRDYHFDTDFLTPSLLPPRTPMFRDLNTLGFVQVTGAGK